VSIENVEEFKVVWVVKKNFGPLEGQTWLFEDREDAQRFADSFSDLEVEKKFVFPKGEIPPTSVMFLVL